jgi:RNase P subunit RPR2
MKLITNKFKSYCKDCKKELKKGYNIYYDLSTKYVYCVNCGLKQPTQYNNTMPDPAEIQAENFIINNKI